MMAAPVWSTGPLWWRLTSSATVFGFDPGWGRRTVLLIPGCGALCEGPSAASLRRRLSIREVGEESPLAGEPLEGVVAAILEDKV